MVVLYGHPLRLRTSALNLKKLRKLSDTLISNSAFGVSKSISNTKRYTQTLHVCGRHILLDGNRRSYISLNGS